MSVLAPSATAQYVESFESWSATSAGTWETKDLSGAPYNVPGLAVVEIAIRNSNATASRHGGVRATGSTLERRFNVSNAITGGSDVIMMHVQTDANGRIEEYAENIADVDFVLVGYWECGSYVERFDLFNSTGSWNDVDLNAYGIGPNDVVEIVILDEQNSQAYDAGVRTNGSTLERRVKLQRQDVGDDAVTMFVKADSSASATIEAYAGNPTQVDFYIVGYWLNEPGDYTETMVDIGSPVADATWEDVDLTASGVPDEAIVEVLFANDTTVDANEIGVRANGSTTARLLDLTAEHDSRGDGNFGRMQVASDPDAVIEFRHQNISDAHSFYLLGYWRSGAILSDHDAGQVGDAFSQQGGETDAELFAFELTPCSGTITVNEIVFRLTDLAGLTDSDWAGLELVVDQNADGVIDASETTTVAGTGVVDTAAGTITFSTSFIVTGTTSYILRGDFASLSLGDKVTIGLAATDISANSLISGTTTTATHLEQCYIGEFEPWTATTAATWETQNLGSAPFNVPANAIVEVAVRNGDGSNEHWGGVRAIGSTLDRRIQLHEAESGGYDFVTMHVQSNADSQIEHYAETTTDIDFVLLGYWECGTYVETFDSFTAGASGSWVNRSLWPFGVRPTYVAEVVATNTDPSNEWECGVRETGSVLTRTVVLHEAEDGGVDAGTFFVKADTTTAANIEMYAGSDANINFYLAGYWSVAPLSYTELSANIGSPAASATWEGVDLTASGVPDAAIAELILANQDATNRPSDMGGRTTGSSVDRIFTLHEAESGGSDIGRAQVQTDDTASIEFYHGDVGAAHEFRVVGFWSTCNTAVEYAVSDLGAVTASNSSIGRRINSFERVAGFDEDASGNADAWLADGPTLTALGVLGGSYAEALGVNDSDMVVGWSENGSGSRRAFTWTSGGGFTDLGTTSGRLDSEAHQVNENGEVVGTVLDFVAPPRHRLAFIYLPSPAHTLSAGLTSLGTLGGSESMATGINDSGQVVGGAQNANGYYRPFRWQGGVMTDLGTLGGESVLPDHRAESINSSGTVCGRSYTASDAKHAFLWDGTMVDLGVLPGGTQSWAFGLNDNGVVVGTSDVTGGVLRAFIWDATNGMRNLNNLIPVGSGWTLTRANDVNNDGYITGFGTNGNGDVHAFLLTPTCATGGGGVALALASGGGTTNFDGVFEQPLESATGQRLGDVELVNPEQGIRVEYVLVDPPAGTEVAGAPGISSMEGFGNRLAISRRLTVATTTVQEAAALTVTLTVNVDEINALGVSPSELSMHVLEPAEGASGWTWVPAGTDVGESAPSHVVGEMGFTRNDTQSVSYWAVTAGGGAFAVGVNAASYDGSTPGVPTRVCGLGLVAPTFALLLVFMAARLDRRRRCLTALERRPSES